MEKALFIKSQSDINELNRYLSDNWTVKNMVSQHGTSAGGGQTSRIQEISFPILVIIQKIDKS
jgi:hypothetical protein